jgi:hypothetical protein
LTDIISSLADSILELVNSKPSTPTKAELVELLTRFDEQQLTDDLIIKATERLLPLQVFGWKNDEEAEGDDSPEDTWAAMFAGKDMRQIDRDLPPWFKSEIGQQQRLALEAIAEWENCQKRPRTLAEIKERWAAEDKGFAFTEGSLEQAVKAVPGMMEATNHRHVHAWSLISEVGDSDWAALTTVSQRDHGARQLLYCTCGASKIIP